jgi:hypothetical protein
MSRSFEALALAFVLGVSSVASAQALAPETEKAKVLYNEGLDLRDGGDHEGALRLFQVAWSHVRSPVVGLDLAKELVRAGRLVEGLEVAEAIGKLPVAPEETENSAKARTEATTLAESLRTRVVPLKVRVTGMPAIITLDGVTVSAAELENKRLDPGKHTVVVVYASAIRREVLAKEGQPIELAFAEPPPSLATKTELPPEAPKPSYVLAYTGLGVAGAGLVVGTYFGLVAVARANEVRDACSVDGLCPKERESTLHSSRVYATISTIGFAVGAGGLILSGVGFLRAHESKSEAPKTAHVTPFVGLGSIGLSGAF